MGGESADIHCTAKLARRTQRPLEYVHFSTFSSTNLNAPGGFHVIYRDEGWRGLYRGTMLVLVGMSNGALQFMAYEKMKSWVFERKRPWFAKLRREWIIIGQELGELWSKQGGPNCFDHNSPSSYPIWTF